MLELGAENTTSCLFPNDMMMISLVSIELYHSLHSGQCILLYFNHLFVQGTVEYMTSLPLWFGFFSFSGCFSLTVVPRPPLGFAVSRPQL